MSYELITGCETIYTETSRRIRLQQARLGDASYIHINNITQIIKQLSSIGVDGIRITDDDTTIEFVFDTVRYTLSTPLYFEMIKRAF